MASHDNKPNPFAKVIEIVNNSEFNFEAIKHAQAEKLPELVPQDLSGKVVVVTGANAGNMHYTCTTTYNRLSLTSTTPFPHIPSF